MPAQRPPNAPRVLIAGGGLAGLTAAFRLADHADVCVLESAPRFGGQIHTERAHGFLIERGAEGFVARSQAVPALAIALGLPASAVIGQRTLRSYGYDGSQLRALQPGEAASFLGFQVAREDLGKGIRSLQDGMGSLIEALVAALEAHPRVELRAQAQVRAIARATETMLEVGLADSSRLDADALLLATSSASAAELLTGVAGEPARALDAAPTVSSVTVELAFAREAVQHPLDASGFVIAEHAQQHGLRACTFTSSKFPGRAPAGAVSLRLFFRPSAHDLQALDDTAWVARARAGLARAIALVERPRHAFVSRWPNALPVLDAAQRARVAALADALAGTQVALAGSAFHGAGIDAAVQSGERAAAALRAMLGGRRL